MRHLVGRQAYRFGPFVLDAHDRTLTCDGAAIDLNSRYFDALALMLRSPGGLVSKDRFHQEVWRGVPVTDEALTQCIRTLRRLLGDDAAAPRFIETVPKHGYRFVAPVEPAPATAAAPARPQPGIAPLALAGVIGGAIAGACGGLIYGFGGTAADGTGALSVLLVLLSISTTLGLVAGAGVGTGIALVRAAMRNRLAASLVGGAVGGLLVGALVKLVALDAFTLLLGRAPSAITGAAEGLALGAAAGCATGLGGALRLRTAIAATLGIAAGVAITWGGGRLLGGSLDLLVHDFAAARFRLDPLSALVGEASFGPASRMATAALEGGLFAACVTAALILAERRRQ